MIAEILARLALGFLFALWAGAFLGFIWAWSDRAILAIMGIIGLLVILGVLSDGGAEAVHGIDWPFLIGTIPGYIIGADVGRYAYDDLWKRDTSGVRQ